MAWHRRFGRTACTVAILVATACGSGADDPAIGGDPGNSAGDPRGDGGAPSGDDATTPTTPPPVTIAHFGSDAFDDMPQYVAVRKSQTEGGDASARTACEQLLPGLKGLPFYGNAATCVIFNQGIEHAIADSTQRRAVLRQGFEEVRKQVQHESAGGGLRRRLAVVVPIDLLNAPLADVTTYAADLVDAARQAKLPVVFDLDAVDWWQGRPDLWNFFDPAKPGYDPANVANVEWAGEDASSAPKAFWRNWGSQIRVGTPIPNFAGAGYRAAVHAALLAAGAAIKTYVDALAPDEQYLYGGAIIGTELAIGVNHYFYPNGNAYLTAPAKCDPGAPYVAGSGCPAPAGGACAQYNHNVCPPDFGNGTLSGGVAQIGYRGTIDAKLRAPGQAITQAMLDGLVSGYLSFVDGVLTDELRLPSHKVFAHTGGVFNNGAGSPNSYAAARAGTVIPGWSMYFQAPSTTVGTFLDSSATQASLPWSSPEWLGLDPATPDALAWSSTIQTTLDFRNNRMVDVANWEGVSRNAQAVGGIGMTMSMPSSTSCVVTPRVPLGFARVGDTVAVRLSAAQTATATYVNASTSSKTTPAMTLATVDVANVAVSPGNVVTFKTTAPSFFLELATDGCVRDGKSQRTIAPIAAVDVPASPGAWPQAGPWAFARKTDGYALFSWVLDAATTGARVQVADSDAFAPPLLVDEPIPAGAAFYARDGFVPGRTYAVRVVDAQGRTSNVAHVGL